MSLEFVLLYNIPGCTDVGLEKRTRRERDTLYRLLVKQREAENKAIKDSQKKR